LYVAELDRFEHKSGVNSRINMARGQRQHCTTSRERVIYVDSYFIITIENDIKILMQVECKCCILDTEFEMSLT